jgi:hypothetical protein
MYDQRIALNFMGYDKFSMNKSAAKPSDKNLPFLVVFKVLFSIYNKSCSINFLDCNCKYFK